MANSNQWNCDEKLSNALPSQHSTDVFLKYVWVSMDMFKKNVDEYAC